MLALPMSDYLWFVDEALDAMAGIVRDLGDDLANRRPDLPGANSPYVILNHCLGVVDWWAGHVVAGGPSRRDRDAEFRASGPVDELLGRTAEARERLEAALGSLDAAAPPRAELDDEDAQLPLGRTQAGALVHLLGELTQHLGQMELTRDVLVAGARAQG